MPPGVSTSVVARAGPCARLITESSRTVPQKLQATALSGERFRHLGQDPQRVLLIVVFGSWFVPITEVSLAGCSYPRLNSRPEPSPPHHPQSRGGIHKMCHQQGL